ncbi:MAG: GAF domain-containing protein [Acidobacteria bacterium]|nr:GAF domain-containing protein [Acidobacteriota bacterium]
MSAKKTRIISLGVWVVLLFALATMLGAGGFFYYFAKQFEYETCDRYNDKQLEHVKAVAEDLSQLLLRIESDFQYVVSIKDVQSSDPKKVWPHLANCFKRFNGRLTDVSRIDAQGNYITTYLKETELTGQSALFRPSTLQAINSKTLSLAGPYTTKDGTKAVALDIPIFSSDDKGKEIFLGTISGRIDIDSWLKTYVAPYDIHLGSFTWIINQDKQIVAHSNSLLVGQPWDVIAEGSFLDPNPTTTDRSNDYEFLAMAFSTASGKTQIKLGSLGNAEQLVTFASSRFPSTKWVVMSSAPRKAVLKPFHENLRKVWVVAVLFIGTFIIVAIFSLYTEQRKVQVERELRYSLQQSEKKYRTLVERSNDGIVLTSPDGFIKIANRRFAEMLDKSEKDVLGQNLLDFISPNQHSLVKEEWKRREQGTSGSYETELLINKKYNIFVIFSESPVFSLNNEYTGNLAVLTDITDQKRAEQEIKRQNEELFAINSIAETTSKSLILEEIFSDAVKKILETLQLDACAILTINEKNESMTVSASSGLSNDFLSQSNTDNISIKLSYFGRVVETKELVVVDNLSIDDGSVGPRPMLSAVKKEGIVSAAFVPIKLRDECYGIIACGNRNLRSFTKQDTRLLSTIGQAMGIAVEKAQLYQNARTRAMRLETIYRVGDKLTALLELEELLPAVVKLIHNTFNYYNVNIFLYDKETDKLTFTAGFGGFQSPEPLGAILNLNEGIVGHCFLTKEPFLVPDVSKEPKYFFVKSLPETKSELAVPLIIRGNMIGVLDVQNNFINAFDEEDLLTLQVLAEQISVAVENAQLYEKIKHSLDEVRKSQAFFAKIVLESPLATFITDSQGICILVNQSGLSIIGVNKRYDEVIGKYNLLKDKPFVNTPIPEAINKVLKGDVVHLTIDLPAQGEEKSHPKYGTITLKATLFPLADDFGKVGNIVAKFEDLTEKKILEDALQQAQKMESIGTLAGGIAHDFNNILGGVIGYTSFIKNQMPKSDPLYRYINIIESSAKRAADLTQQLLAFARGGKYRVQTLNLNNLVKEAVELIESTIPSNVKLKLTFSPEVLAIEVDGGQIIQTIVNMCINAKDAMPEGGLLNINTSRATLDEQFTYKHPGSRVGNYALLRVSDTGMGMSEETKQRIFEPFFTTKKDRKGTGLGLAMVYGIIKNHQGYIDVDSEIDVGTTFSIYLPTSEKPLEDALNISTSKEGSETILVAEDEDIMRELLVEMLDSGGYQVISAENGKEALDIYNQRFKQIDLVILDIDMPELNGKDAFRRFKEINPDVKVLLSSGYNQDNSSEEILNEGVLGFLQKPYGVNDLLDKIRNVMDSN